MIPVADLHCDLLGYLVGRKERTPHDAAVRCALPQLEVGGVHLQTLAIYTATAPGSVERAGQQLKLFEGLSSPHTTFRAAVENASGLCEEDEPLERAFERLEAFRKRTSLLYISLTWHFENRFGGGNATNIGLKPDGERLLEALDGKGIAIDLSHTSDALADGILEAIDKRGLEIPVIASHSNFRAVHDHPRNLPDRLVREVIRRKGVIGLNLIAKFVGERFEGHLEHALELGIEDHLALGADFFYDGDEKEKPIFFDAYPNASCYPRLFEACRKILSEGQLKGLAHKNVERLITW